MQCLSVCLLSKDDDFDFPKSVMFVFPLSLSLSPLFFSSLYLECQLSVPSDSVCVYLSATADYYYYSFQFSPSTSLFFLRWDVRCFKKTKPCPFLCQSIGYVSTFQLLQLLLYLKSWRWQRRAICPAKHRSLNAAGRLCAVWCPV